MQCGCVKALPGSCGWETLSQRQAEPQVLSALGSSWGTKRPRVQALCESGGSYCRPSHYSVSVQLGIGCSAKTPVCSCHPSFHFYSIAELFVTQSWLDGWSAEWD